MRPSLVFTAILFFTTASTCHAQAVAPLNNPLPFAYETPQKPNERELRDPCIIREGDTYYLVFTMWPFSPPDPKRKSWPDLGSSPGIRVFTSKDLKSWTPGKWLVKSSELPDTAPYKHRFWAPEIHKFGDKFYLIFTADNWTNRPDDKHPAHGMYAFVGVADRPDGPYEHITQIPDGPCDTTLFQADDGKTYAVMPAGDIFIRQIDLSKLDQGRIDWVGERRKIVTADNTDIGKPAASYCEGPWVRRIDGKYVLFYAAFYSRPGGKSLYWTNAAYADTPAGPWTKDPRGGVFYGGHLSTFRGPGDQNYFAYRCETDAARGTLCAQSFTLDAQGRVAVTPDVTAAPPGQP